METRMTPYAIAVSYLGTIEGPGPENNPVIVEMYSTVGHDWVEHDSVAWCAAFVGHCLERAGLRSTRKLNARSYMDWGVPVDLAEAQEGDIVVFTRGNPSGWQGHVGFYKGVSGSSIEVLGGNQADAVNVRRYSKSRLLGVRRAGNVTPSAPLTVLEVQRRLRTLGYHEVGVADGIMGSRTRGAILAFRDDNDLPRVPVIDVALAEALDQAIAREVSPARETGKPKQSRIVNAANAQIGLGVFGALGSVGSQIGPVVSELEVARDTVERTLAVVGLEEWLAAVTPWLLAAVFVGVVVYAIKARSARIEDHRTGRTM
jgi:uncharacterized protein (TIGR02594 family)